MELFWVMTLSCTLPLEIVYNSMYLCIFDLFLYVYCVLCIVYCIWIWINRMHFWRIFREILLILSINHSTQMFNSNVEHFVKICHDQTKKESICIFNRKFQFSIVNRAKDQKDQPIDQSHTPFITCPTNDQNSS